MAGAAAALGAVLPGARTRAWRRLGAVGFVAWCALTAEFAWARLRRGPRTRDELTTVLMTSALIPPVAVYHRLRGELVERRRVRAVLFDRDGTLVVDVPYNGDPELARPVPEAARSLARLRAHGLQLAVVSNQSGVARGLLTTEAVERVNARIDDLLGPIAWWYCPHGETDACGCRKPAPGLVLAAAAALGVPARRCVVIGDTEADVLAARNARCRGILVPNARTRTDEIERAAEVAVDLEEAVDLVLGGAR
jgi:histidinol-phosphate phosphatase family protein